MGDNLRSKTLQSQVALSSILASQQGSCQRHVHTGTNLLTRECISRTQGLCYRMFPISVYR